MKKAYLPYLVLIVLIAACSTPDQKHITILYTADEHGYFADNAKGDGAAALMHIWQDKEGYDLDTDAFLVLSGGDMWMGASASTYYKGQSMFQVMQAMGYDAAALGNHEFDFSIDTLQARSLRNTFPYLAANVRDNNGEIPSFIQPWMLQRCNGVQVGILGLANVKTPDVSLQKATQGLTFYPYDSTLSRYVPQMKQAGADVIIILGHICHDEMTKLAPLAKSLDIPLIMGGHCHEEVVDTVDGVLLVGSAPFWQSYSKLVIAYDPLSKSSVVCSTERVAVKSEVKDEAVAALVAQWEDGAQAALTVPIGYSQTGISRTSPMMQHLLFKAWMQHLPDADIAITNRGGLRQNIEVGVLTTGDVLGLLPFDNELLMLEVRGADLREFWQGLAHYNEHYIWAGLSPNATLEDNKKYRLLTTDFLYDLKETRFKTYDDSPYYSGVSYRAPVLTYIKDLQTTERYPLENYIK